MSVSWIGLLVVCCCLLTISALISASEVAFFSISQQQLLLMKNSKSVNDQRILKLLKNPERLIATILISNNLANIFFVIFSTYFLSEWLNPLSNRFWNFAIEVMVIVSFVVLIGEILPKICATRNPLKFSKFIVGFILFLRWLFSPISVFLVGSMHFIDNYLQKRGREILSIDDISQAIELTTSVEEEEKEMLQGIVQLGNILVDGAMTPRTDMEAIDIKMSFDKMVEKIVECGYSRIPVYAESYDDIKGILYAKDLIQYIGDTKSVDWQTLIRPAYFVPESKKIDDLLNDFQKNKIHMAIVIDEFGGTSGLITMEDILEEVMGEIDDEYDEDRLLYEKIDDSTYTFEAKIPLNDFFKVTGVAETDFTKFTNDVDSLGGLVLEIKGEIPSKSEKIAYKNYVFEVLAADSRRVKKIKLYIKQ